MHAYLSRRWEQLAAILFLIVQPLVFFRRVLFNPTAHVPFDIESFHLPLAAYIARSVRQGVFPFWDPYPYGGAPIHADIQAQLFYPFTWISILLGNQSSGRKLYYWLEWQIPLHMILAGLFAYLLARHLEMPPVSALFAAIVFQVGGFFASQAQHLAALCCAAWLPLILLCILKLNEEVKPKWIAVLALSSSLAILGGFPAAAAVIFIVAGFTSVSVCWARGINWKFAAAVLLGFLWGVALSVVQLVPTYQVSKLSIATLRSQWLGSGGGLRWQSLVSLINPNHYHIFQPFDTKLFTLPINFTMLYVYCGLIPLVLILATAFLTRNRLAKGLLLATVFCAVWMLGDTTKLYSFVFTHLPSILAGALYAEYALLAFSLAAALTAAATLARLSRSQAWPLPKFALWAIVAITSADLLLFGANKPMNKADKSWKESNSEYELAGFPGSLAQIRKLVNTGGPPRRIDFADAGAWNFIWGSELTQLPTMDGSNPLMFRRVYDLRRIYGSGQPWERDSPVGDISSPLVRMSNIGLLGGQSVEARHRLAASGLPHIADIAGLDLYAVTNSLPRFYLVPSALAVKDQAQALVLLARPDFAPEKEAVVEGEIPTMRPSEGAVSVLRYSPNQIELNVQSNGPAFLASSEPYYPGWTATINGKSTPLYMTNGAFRGLVVGPGTSRVVMRYWPPHFLWWVGISGISFALVLGVLIQAALFRK